MAMKVNKISGVVRRNGRVFSIEELSRIEEERMSRIRSLIVMCAVVLFGMAPTAWAHFGTIIPSDDIITQQDSKTITLEVKFIHPLEMHYMTMEKPKQFGVLFRGKKDDLLKTLESAQGKSPVEDQTVTFWKATYTIKRPGDYTFFVEPTPYWEPAEDKFIVHYTKVCVDALGLEEGWDEPVGLETEIIPLTRPYGLWTGNLFTGQVLLEGKPVPNAELEIEYLNESPDNKTVVKAPSDPYVTQVVKADGDGVFSYAMPRAGWWGFAALNDAPWKLEKDGKPKDVELGAVYWVHTIDMK
jgi:cobalt/nickel transport protein